MLKLKKHVIVVGPDRCWKTSLIRDMQKYYANRSYKGERGDDEAILKLFESQEAIIFDRGLICDRVYNRYFLREVPKEIAYVKHAAELATELSGAVYIFMTRHSFEGVRDDKYPDTDLQELHNIYVQELLNVKNRVKSFYVDNVKSADLHYDTAWVSVMGRVFEYLKEYESEN